MNTCQNCGGWDESEYPWDGDTGYPCLCIRCIVCGEAYGSSMESYDWNTAQWEYHLAENPHASPQGYKEHTLRVEPWVVVTGCGRVATVQRQRAITRG